jgi:hypothetical protein
VAASAAAHTLRPCSRETGSGSWLGRKSPAFWPGGSGSRPGRSGVFGEWWNCRPPRSADVLSPATTDVIPAYTITPAAPLPEYARQRRK